MEITRYQKGKLFDSMTTPVLGKDDGTGISRNYEVKSILYKGHIRAPCEVDVSEIDGERKSIIASLRVARRNEKRVTPSYLLKVVGEHFKQVDRASDGEFIRKQHKRVANLLARSKS